MNVLALIATAPPLAAAGEFNAGGELLRVLLSLAGIVLLIWGAGVLSRRLQRGRAGHGGRRIRCVETFAVGARERIVLLEADGQRLLVGTGPGGMRTLHVYPRDAGDGPSATETPSARTMPSLAVPPVFGELLARWKKRA